MVETTAQHDSTGFTCAAPEPPATERPLPEPEAQLTELAGHLSAATHRWLVLLAEFDRRQGWADGALRSCAHWLGWRWAGWWRGCATSSGAPIGGASRRCARRGEEPRKGVRP